MQGIIHLAHCVVKMLSILQGSVLESSFAGVQDELLDLVRCDLLANVLAMPQENSQQIQKQIVEEGLAHCRERVIVVRVWRLRRFRLPSCSSLAKGCALSRYIECYCKVDKRPWEDADGRGHVSKAYRLSQRATINKSRPTAQYNTTLDMPPTTPPARLRLSLRTPILIRKHSRTPSVTHQPQQSKAK
jgi:hypothetical protein